MNNLGLRMTPPSRSSTSGSSLRNSNKNSSVNTHSRSDVESNGGEADGIFRGTPFQSRGRRSFQFVLLMVAGGKFLLTPESTCQKQKSIEIVADTADTGRRTFNFYHLWYVQLWLNLGMVLGAFFILMLREQGIDSLETEWNDELDIKGSGGAVQLDPLEPPRGQAFPASLPGECSRGQMVALRKVFSEDGCTHEPHRQACSFTKATTHGPHTLPYYIDYWKSKWNGVGESPFLGVFMECANTPALAVGSLFLATQNEKYSLTNFLQKYDPSNVDNAIEASVWRDIGRTHASSNPNHGTAYCLGTPGEKMDNLVSITSELGWGNDGEFLVRPNDPKQMPLDRLSRDFPILNEGRPIHFLHLESHGFDDELLSGGKDTLQLVEYLQFTYTWKGSWPKQNFKDAIEFLAHKNFVCYWNGTEGRLWRITGCWLDMYEHHNWSHVNCVNAEAAPDLLEKMEAVFERTLSKEFEF